MSRSLLSPAALDHAAEAVVNAIMRDSADGLCHRIELKGGQYPSRETNLGGFNRDAMFIAVRAALATATAIDMPFNGRVF